MIRKNGKPRINLNLILISGIIVFIIIGVAAYQSLNTSIQKAKWVEHTHKVLYNSEKMYAFLKELESAQRGYIISGNNIYIQNYFSSQDSVFHYLNVLMGITADNPIQQARITHLGKIIEARLDRLLFVMRLKESNETEKIVSLMNNGEGRARMNEIRGIIRHIDQEEQNLLHIRSTEFDTSIRRTQIIIYTVLTFYSAIAILLISIIKTQWKTEKSHFREVDKLNHAINTKNEQLFENNTELNAMNEELAASNEELASNSEALIVSNEQLFALKQQLEARVQERTLQLEQTNRELESKVVQQEKTEQTLKNALHELKQRNYELDNYVYKASHDLRAPLTSMMGLITLIQAENDVDSIKKYADMINTRVNKMDEFIKSSLNHSRIINVQAQSAEIDFKKIIQDCLDELQYLANREKVNVIIDVQQEEEFLSDLLKMHIIFKNLTTNAIKYCNPNAAAPFVKFHIQVLNDQALIVIQDNGIGIKEEYIKKVFDMFFRATEKSEGSGLGLYIVKQTVLCDIKLDK